MAKTTTKRRSTRTDRRTASDVLSLLHHLRWRKVSNRFPLQVAYAYEGDIERALSELDGQVLATVAKWERKQGLEPRDWLGLGHAEGRVHSKMVKKAVAKKR
jgi:hypothetical protein